MAYVPEFDPSTLFELLDTNKDGLVNADEIVEFLISNGIVEDEFTYD